MDLFDEKVIFKIIKDKRMLKLLESLKKPPLDMEDKASDFNMMPPLRPINLIIGKSGKIEVEKDCTNMTPIIADKIVDASKAVETVVEKDSKNEAENSVDIPAETSEKIAAEKLDEKLLETEDTISRLSLKSLTFVPLSTNEVNSTNGVSNAKFEDIAVNFKPPGDIKNYRKTIPPGESSVIAFVSTVGTDEALEVVPPGENSYRKTSFVSSGEYRTRNISGYTTRTSNNRNTGSGRGNSSALPAEGFTRLCYIKPSALGTDRVVVVPNTPTQEFNETGMLRPILGAGLGKASVINIPTPQRNIHMTLQKQQQQQQQSNESIGDNVKPYLLFKNLPPMLNKRGLQGLCSPYGRVIEVRNHNNEYMTVTFATINDMLNVYRILEHNIYGFQVEIGKKLPETKVEKEIKKLFTKTPVIKNLESDFQSRCDISLSPNKKPDRPIFSEKPIVTHEDYAAKNNLLHSNDPKKFYMYETDHHTSEHLSLDFLNSYHLRKPHVNYRNGRAYIPRTPVVLNKENVAQLTTNNPQACGFVDKFKRNFLNCLMCGDFSKYSCSNCSSSYYCSYKCQKSDWQRHRSTCGKQVAPPPPFVKTQPNEHNVNTYKFNEPFTSKVKKLLPINSPKPQTEKFIAINMMPSLSTVVITSVAKTNTVFVRPKTMEFNEIYRQTINKIQSACFRKLYCAPVLGQIVVAKFEGIFNRAMVINVDNMNSICIVHMDFGNLDKKHISELFDCPEYYITLPRLVVPVLLKRVPEFFMTEQVRKYLYSYLDNGSLTLKYDEVNDFNDRVGVYEVELFDQRKDIYLNDVLEKICTPLAGIKLSGDRRYFTRHYLRQNVLPVGENIELLVMDNSNLDNSFVSCTVSAYAFEIDKFNHDIQRYAEMFNKFRHEPQLDELVIARYSKDKRWYRGRCIKAISGVFPVIQYIDYGNMEVVSCDNLLPYPREFTFPIYTADCVIEGLPSKCDPELTKRLESLLVIGAVMRCNKVELYKSENYYKITLNEVVKMFKIQGLLD